MISCLSWAYFGGIPSSPPGMRALLPSIMPAKSCVARAQDLGLRFQCLGSAGFLVQNNWGFLVQVCGQGT